MIQEIESRHEVKIRKTRRCHNCERKFDKGSIMIASVWKEDDIYRVHECTNCINWVNENKEAYQDLCISESLYPGWIKEV